MIHWYGRPWYFQFLVRHETVHWVTTAWLLVWDFGPVGGVIRLRRRP